MQRIADGRRHDDDHDDDDEQLDVRGLADRNARSISRNGQVTFTTIHPGWYAGRATHIHVDVYRSGAQLLNDLEGPRQWVPFLVVRCKSKHPASREIQHNRERIA